MMEPETMFATVAIAAIVLASVTLVLSRIIPDDYDNRVPVRRRIEPAKPPREP
jgi:hypothetical protein